MQERVMKRLEELTEEYKKQSVIPHFTEFLTAKLIEKEDWEKNVRSVMSRMPYSFSELIGETYEDEDESE